LTEPKVSTISHYMNPFSIIALALIIPSSYPNE